MTILTEYSIDEEVWVRANGDIKPGKISQINAEVTAGVSGPITRVNYKVALDSDKDGPKLSFYQDSVYKSKLEGVYSWIKKQNLSPSEVIQGYMDKEKE